MPKKRQLPYLEKIGQRGEITVWAVDGSYVRDNIDKEFTDYGHHYTYPYIPLREFWIDSPTTPEETGFFIRHMLVEYRLMKKGMDYEGARFEADQAERQLREESGDVGKMTKGGRLPDPERVHLRIWKKLGSGLTVWIVDGRLVRSVFNIEFTEGGHEHVYEFVPEDEVWIENDVGKAERPYVLLHELHERNLMEQGQDYDSAHEESSELEHYYRKHPDELHTALAKEGWE